MAAKPRRTDPPRILIAHAEVDDSAEVSVGRAPILGTDGSSGMSAIVLALRANYRHSQGTAGWGFRQQPEMHTPDSDARVGRGSRRPIDDASR